MSMYPSSRAGGGNIVAILILGLALALAGGAIVGYYSLRESRPTLDPQTFCPTDGPRSRTVLLLDVSDPLTALQRAALRTLLRDLRNPKLSGTPSEGSDRIPLYLEPYGQLVAYLLDAESGRQEPFLRICNPGSPEDSDGVTSSPIRVAARWDAFEDEIDQTFAKIPASATLPRSPLLEALVLIVEEEAPSLVVRSAGENMPFRLIIFSDMLQHSESMSHFQGLVSWSDLRSIPEFSSLKSQLLDIDVVIYYLLRPQYDAVQTDQHYQWWRQAISYMGGDMLYMVAK